jgi:hypothetical protein
MMSKVVNQRFHIGGRRVRPFSLALLISTFVVAYQYEILEAGPGTDASDLIETMFAAVTITLLITGWFFNDERLHRAGLAMAAGVWAARSALYAFDFGITHIAVWLSLAWVVGCVGAWILESYDAKWRDAYREHVKLAGGGKGCE